MAESSMRPWSRSAWGTVYVAVQVVDSSGLRAVAGHVMEFELIDAIRMRVNIRRDDVALGVGDDAAVLDVPAGRQLSAFAFPYLGKKSNLGYGAVRRPF